MMADESCALENHETRTMVCCKRHLKEFCSECAPPQQHVAQAGEVQDPQEEANSQQPELEAEQETEEKQEKQG